MHDNARLAKLILDQIEGEGNAHQHDPEIRELLQAAVGKAQSRLDLRDRLFAGARASNSYTPADIAETISQNLADLVRDMDDDLAEIADTLMPSRFLISASIATMFGALTGLIYGVADGPTVSAVFGFACFFFFASQVYRKRVSRHVSKLRKQRTNYDEFRNLLRNSL